MVLWLKVNLCIDMIPFIVANSGRTSVCRVGATRPLWLATVLMIAVIWDADTGPMTDPLQVSAQGHQHFVVFFGVGSGGITNTVSVIALKKVVLHCLPCCHLHHSEKIHHGRGFKVLSTPVTQNPDEGEVVKKVVVKHKLPTPHNEVPVIAGCARWCHEVVVLALEAARCVCVVHVENHNEILKKSALNLKLGEVLNDNNNLLPLPIYQLALLLQIIQALLVPQHLVLYQHIPLLLGLGVEGEGLVPLFFCVAQFADASRLPNASPRSSAGHCQ